MKENGDFVEEPKYAAQLLNKYFLDIGKTWLKLFHQFTERINQHLLPILKTLFLCLL